ncbi:hypothetical protein [Desulforamulus profundi]|uniref:hypothetical protein n=1 Tax=Desulforamulus profundi TaxID=1383067 RepID=UPI001EE635E1|nr:hypothetical protein [Desulforamulus profundi]
MKDATYSTNKNKGMQKLSQKLKNLFPKIIDFENLYIAALEARKGKRFRDEILKFNSQLEENLIIIQNELLYKTYEVGKYRQFFIHDPKKRLIMHCLSKIELFNGPYTGFYTRSMTNSLFLIVMVAESEKALIKRQTGFNTGCGR